MNQDVVASDTKVEQVRDFWNAHPCGIRFVNDALFGTPDFFRRYSEFRYESEYHLNDLVPFEQYQGKQVLEIGSGLGADGVRFAQNGAIYTGIDLTEAAVEATRLHFRVLGLSGAFIVQNAERMADLDDDVFDLVYSHGVLHHTPCITDALQEIHRVLKSRGKVVLMLYHRHSLNYYARILGYKRLTVLTYVLFRRWLPLRWRTGDVELHYQNYLRTGMSYFSANKFAHRCADGPGCPLANSYTRREVQHLLAPYFTDLRFSVAHLPIHNTLRFFPRRAERLLASWMGWYLFIYGEKR
jgi:SAM-dependent methyltransferase